MSSVFLVCGPIGRNARLMREFDQYDSDAIGPPVVFGRASSSVVASTRCCTNKIIEIIVMTFLLELR